MVDDGYNAREKANQTFSIQFFFLGFFELKPKGLFSIGGINKDKLCQAGVTPYPQTAQAIEESSWQLS